MRHHDEFPDIKILYREHNGKKVTVNGRSHTIKYSEYRAVYPYIHQAVHVSLEPVNKTSAWYRDMRDKCGGGLGDGRIRIG